VLCSFIRSLKSEMCYTVVGALWITFKATSVADDCDNRFLFRFSSVIVCRQKYGSYFCCCESVNTFQEYSSVLESVQPLERGADSFIWER
jgi:hypothetical protein